MTVNSTKTQVMKLDVLTAIQYIAQFNWFTAIILHWTVCRSVSPDRVL